MNILNIFLFFVFLLPSQTGEDIFRYDKSGKVTYTEVVKRAGFSKEVLLANAMEYFESSDKKTRRKRKFVKLINQDSLLEYQRSTILYAKSLGKYPEGKLTYTVRLELKDNRYRYAIQNFVFAPYAKNRFAKFEEVRGKSKTLESMLFGPQSKDDDKRNQNIDDKIRSLITSMNLAMAQVNVDKKKEVVEMSDDW